MSFVLIQTKIVMLICIIILDTTFHLTPQCRKLVTTSTMRGGVITISKLLTLKYMDLKNEQIYL